MEAVRPSLVYSMGLPPTRAGLFLLHLPKEPDGSSPAASPHSLYGPCMLPWPPFGGWGEAEFNEYHFPPFPLGI